MSNQSLAQQVAELQSEADKAKQADTGIYWIVIANGLQGQLDEQSTYFETGIKDDAERVGMDTRGLVGMAIVHEMANLIQERVAWSKVAEESNKAVNAYLHELMPELPEHYGMPVDGIRRVVANLQAENEGVRKAATDA